jgi:hypothetical protein
MTNNSICVSTMRRDIREEMKTKKKSILLIRRLNYLEIYLSLYIYAQLIYYS